MSTNTKNLKLIQQESHEYYDLNITNENLDIIDSEIGEKLNSPNLLNPNITNFEVGVGTVEETLKYYTEQMKQSIVTIDNIQGNTRKIGETLQGVYLNRIVKVENENSTINLLKGKPSIIGTAYGDRGRGTYYLDMLLKRTYRIAYLELVDVIPGNQYTIKNFSSDNMIFIAHYYDEYGCKLIDGDVDWVTTPNVYTFIAPLGCYKIMIYGKKADNSNIRSSELDSLKLMFVQGTEPTSYVESDYRSQVYEYENIQLHRISPTGVFDEVKDGKLIKRLSEINTSNTYFEVTDFSTAGDYGRLEVILPNSIVYMVEHAICDKLPVYRYNSNTKKWSAPDENCIILNRTSTDTSRIYFVIENQRTQDAILTYIKQLELKIIYQRMNPIIEDINLTVLANKGDKIQAITPVNASCTHKVSLNAKSQIEDTQKVTIKEKGILWNKIANLFDVNMNLQQIGYIKLPSIFGGLMLQWGRIASNELAITGTAKFPIKFNSYCLNVQSTAGWGTGNTVNQVVTYGKTTTGFDYRISSTNLTEFLWLAIGY